MFSLRFNDLQRRAAISCNMNATWTVLAGGSPAAGIYPHAGAQ
jgi:hypothetical protein